MNSDRFRFFSSVLRESDLQIGLSHHFYQPSLEAICRKEQERLYSLLSDHIARNHSFASSLDPLPMPDGPDSLAPELVSMYRCAEASETGPMSSVAGLFAEAAGKAILAKVKEISAEDVAMPDSGDMLDSCEVVVENGGDLFVRNMETLVVVIHAGDSALSGKLGLVIPPGEWGICTSSGTHGHSFSKGNADALTIVSRSTPLADAWATALANQVRGKEDIPPLLDRIAEIPEILAGVIIAGGEMGIRGEFEIKLLS